METLTHGKVLIGLPGKHQHDSQTCKAPESPRFRKSRFLAINAFLFSTTCQVPLSVVLLLGGPPDLDPLILIFVTWAKEYILSEENNVYYRGTLRGLQTKLFGIGLYQSTQLFRRPDEVLDHTWAPGHISYA